MFRSIPLLVGVVPSCGPRPSPAVHSLIASQSSPSWHLYFEKHNTYLGLSQDDCPARMISSWLEPNHPGCVPDLGSPAVDCSQDDLDLAAEPDDIFRIHHGSSVEVFPAAAGAFLFGKTDVPDLL